MGTVYPQLFALLAAWLFASVAAVGAFSAYRNARTAASAAHDAQFNANELVKALAVAKRQHDELLAEVDALKVRFTRLAARTYAAGRRNGEDGEEAAPVLDNEFQRMLELQQAYGSKE